MDDYDYILIRLPASAGATGRDRVAGGTESVIPNSVSASTSRCRVAQLIGTIKKVIGATDGRRRSRDLLTMYDESLELTRKRLTRTSGIFSATIVFETSCPGRRIVRSPSHGQTVFRTHREAVVRTVTLNFAWRCCA